MSTLCLLSVNIVHKYRFIKLCFHRHYSKPLTNAFHYIFQMTPRLPSARWSKSLRGLRHNIASKLCQNLSYWVVPARRRPLVPTTAASAWSPPRSSITIYCSDKIWWATINQFHRCPAAPRICRTFSRSIWCSNNRLRCRRLTRVPRTCRPLTCSAKTDRPQFKLLERDRQLI